MQVFAGITFIEDVESSTILTVCNRKTYCPKRLQDQCYVQWYHRSVKGCFPGFTGRWPPVLLNIITEGYFLEGIPLVIVMAVGSYALYKIGIKPEYLHVIFMTFTGRIATFRYNLPVAEEIIQDMFV